MKLNLKNIIAVAILLSATTMFWACDPEGEKQGIPSPPTQILNGLYMFGDKGENEIPISFDLVRWEKDDTGKYTKYFSYEDINYSDDNIMLAGVKDYGSTLHYDTIIILLDDNGYIKQKQTNRRETYSDNTPYGKPYVVDFLKYYYDKDGFLVRVTNTFPEEGEKDLVLLTVENSNVTQVKELLYPITGREAYQTITYDYTYDDKDFIPMSDWAPCTPLQVVALTYLTPFYDNLLGQKSKNNIVDVDIQYEKPEYQAHFNKITYAPEYDEEDRLVAIKHTGRVTKSQGGGGNSIDFDNVKTTFLYKKIYPSDF
ncbi:hypothetical protein [Paludibacter sp. 221]|uniref:hypothetical protein n=1 Tax=Paludibacter sp. 221 TaxID=2302939 RepID=UPI0013CFF637|nr:hypothetical protein [Paludibacter sp. 221]